jgi:hypothetical protein
MLTDQHRLFASTVAALAREHAIGEVNLTFRPLELVDKWRNPHPEPVEAVLTYTARVYRWTQDGRPAEMNYGPARLSAQMAEEVLPGQHMGGEGGSPLVLPERLA